MLLVALVMVRPQYPCLKDKVVLVTGASSGIGAVTAAHFAAQSCRLSLVGRNLSALEATRDKCQEAGGGSQDNILVIKCDLRSELECQEAVRRTAHFYGGLKDFLFIEEVLMSKLE